MEKRPPTRHIAVRFTFAEVASIKAKAEAANITVSDHIRSRALDEDSDRPAPRRRRREPTLDQKAYTQLIGILGQSHLSANVNQLAKAANSGSLPVTPDTEAALNEAASAIREMRRLLIEALNLQVEP